MSYHTDTTFINFIMSGPRTQCCSRPTSMTQASMAADSTKMLKKINKLFEFEFSIFYTTRRTLMQCCQKQMQNISERTQFATIANSSNL